MGRRMIYEIPRYHFPSGPPGYRLGGPGDDLELEVWIVAEPVYPPPRARTLAYKRP